MAEETNVVISTFALIAKFQQAIDEKWGYIYGKTHEKWSKAKQEAYDQAKAGDANCQNSIKYGPQWYGHWVTDCSGLFAWAFKQLGGYMYHGSNTMYNKYCTDKGTLSGGKRSDGKELKAGTSVYTGTEGKHGHVGLYIGNGYVIEAMGAKNGVVKSKVSEDKWTYWGELKGVDYGGSPQPQPTPTPTPTPAKGEAIVTGKNLALRQGPSTKCHVITRIPTGKTVKLVDQPSDWTYVKYGNNEGFVMNKYIKKG